MRKKHTKKTGSLHFHGFSVHIPESICNIVCILLLWRQLSWTKDILHQLVQECHQSLQELGCESHQHRLVRRLSSTVKITWSFLKTDYVHNRLGDSELPTFMGKWTETGLYSDLWVRSNRSFSPASNACLAERRPFVGNVIAYRYQMRIL